MGAARPQSHPHADGSSAAGQPTIFVGLGGAATAVLKAVRRRFVEAKPEDVLPRPSQRERDGLGRPSSSGDAVTASRDIRFLAIDTDRTSLHQAQQAEDDAALLPDETLHLPLRKPAEYRQASDEILSWLSRRWLYNIPRSLRTEGLRPLGRLAFVDHRETIANRLRRLLSGQPPRVFILASVDGGAGGGMLLDVAYAVRHQLDQLKLAADCFCGVMLHATLAGSPSNDLRKANAYATLTELNHFMLGGAAFRAGPVEVLPVGDVSEPPFHDAYFIRLGEELNSGDFDRSLDQVAEYLYLNATWGAAALAHFRRNSRQNREAETAVRLRCFGLHTVRVRRQAMAREEAERVCFRLVRSWTGDDTDESLARSRLQPPAFGLDQLVERVQSLAEQALGGSCETHFRTLVLPPAEFAAAYETTGERFGDVLRRVHAVLGSPISNADQPSQCGRVETTLAGATKQLAAAMGRALVDSIETLVDQPQARLPAALAGVNLYQQHLRDLRQAADQLAEAEQLRARAVCARLEQGSLPSERFWFSRFTTSSAVVEESLLAYCRSLLQLMLYKQTVRCLQEMMSMVAALNERLLTLRQSLRWLTEEFAETVPSTERPLAGCRISEQNLFRESLLMLADDPQRWRELARQLRETARSMLCAALTDVDAGSLLLEQYPTDQALDTWFAAAVSKTATSLNPSGGNDRLLILLPQGSNYERLATAVDRCIPGSTKLVSQDGDLVLLREIEDISLAEVATQITESHDECTAAAQRLLTRVDVAWSPLPIQAVEG